MGWSLLAMLILLGIGVPILNMIYQGFLNTTNGSWQNWTINGTAPYSTFELGIFQSISWLAALMAIIFIVLLVSGRYSRKDQQM